jgi:pyrimidine operon attenuation protein/uracil phosphoribosyltransferase
MPRNKPDLELMKTIADEASLKVAIEELGQQINAALSADDSVVVVGIRVGGEAPARSLATLLSQLRGADIPLGFLDITLYRDDINDLGYLPEVGITEIDFPIDDAVVVLVDDVLYTGRTVRSAIDELIDFGRPKRIRLVVIVERDGRELPIQADYSAYKVETDPGEVVKVCSSKERNGVFILKAKENDAKE